MEYKTSENKHFNILKCLFSELSLFYILLKYSVAPVIFVAYGPWLCFSDHLHITRILFESIYALLVSP
jgi:hypothetical protein